MTQIISAGLANAQAALINSSFSDGYLDFYGGDPATAPLLAPCKLPIAPFYISGAGLIALSGQWFGTCIAPGTLSWAQFRDNTGVFMNVSVSEAGGGGQMIVSQAVVVYGDVISVNHFVYQAPLA